MKKSSNSGAGFERARSNNDPHQTDGTASAPPHSVNGPFPIIIAKDRDPPRWRNATNPAWSRTQIRCRRAVSKGSRAIPLCSDVFMPATPLLPSSRISMMRSP